MLRHLGARVSAGAPLASSPALAAVDSEERRLAWTVNAILYMMGGITLACFIVLPGVHARAVPLLIVAAVACLVRWLLAGCALARAGPRRAHLRLHRARLRGHRIRDRLVGGGTSPAWIYLFFVALFAACFFRPPVAIAFLAGCVATHAVALLYDRRALHDEFLAQLLIAAIAYLALGGAIIAGKALMLRLRSRAEELAAEQSALRRVATAVVEGDPPERIYELVAVEAASLLGAGAAGILRLDGLTEATVMGSWADHVGGRYEPGAKVQIRPESDVRQALETKRPVRIEAHSPDSAVGRLGHNSSIVTPIRVAGETWGVLAVTAAEPARLGSRDEQRLMEFGDLLATAIASIEDRAKLAAQASSDPLTGLANHRTLQQRLGAEVSRASRHGSMLAVAVLDIDHFKQINDIGGHDAGDEMLLRVARCLGKLARAEDTLGRVGGDEFAWILPETSREQALAAVERARRVIAATATDSFRLTVSAGICDTRTTEDAAELLRLADGALYWSKAHGRDQSWIYDPAIVNELSADERAERLERSQVLLGLRALARAIDAKDPATREHSERVSALVRKLARTAGWGSERALQLSEAALVRDVGKIGVPDAVLRKTTPLSAEERRQIEGHAELAARIVEGVLAPEQVEWIRKHHERPDGRGYPRGLAGDQIPEGATLMALADAWDVMTVSRPYSVPKSVEAALAECTELVGRQFTETAVAALVALHGAGELPIPDTDAEALVSP